MKFKKGDLIKNMLYKMTYMVVGYNINTNHYLVAGLYEGNILRTVFYYDKFNVDNNNDVVLLTDILREIDD
jgi:hypothetical protein